MREVIITDDLSGYKGQWVIIKDGRVASAGMVLKDVITKFKSLNLGKADGLFRIPVDAKPSRGSST